MTQNQIDHETGCIFKLIRCPETYLNKSVKLHQTDKASYVIQGLVTLRDVYTFISHNNNNNENYSRFICLVIRLKAKWIQQVFSTLSSNPFPLSLYFTATITLSMFFTTCNVGLKAWSGSSVEIFQI